MTDITAPYEYFADPDRGRPISNGYIYVGLPNLDPETPANQVSVSGKQEGGTVVALSQPIRTNAGGLPVYNGGVVQLSITEDAYSIKVKNFLNATEYFQDNVETGLSSAFFAKNFASVAALVASSGNADYNNILIESYHAVTYPSAAGPKGCHYAHRTGGTNSSPTVGSPVPVSTIGTGTQAGYYWDADGIEWFITINDGVYRPTEFGAKGDAVTDDATAIQDCITRALADKAAASFKLNIVIDFGGLRYAVGAPIDVVSGAYVEFRGSFRFISLHSDEYILKLDNCGYFRLTGHMFLEGNGGATFTNRNNMYGLLINDTARSKLDNIVVQYTIGDGIRVTGSSTLTDFGSLGTLQCGSTGTGSAGAPTSTITAENQTGSVNSAGQRHELTMASVPQQLKDYLDDTVADSSSVKAAYISIEGSCHFVFSYSGDTLTVWPWYDAATAVGRTVNFIFGAGLFATGGDVSVLNIGSHDQKLCGVGYAGYSLYPAVFRSAVSQSCGIALMLGFSTSSSANNFSAQYYYFESNLFDIVQGSQADCPTQIEQTTALNLSKCQRLWSANASGTRVNSFLGSTGITGFEGKKYRDVLRLQATSSAFTMDFFQPDPVHIIANTSTVTIADNQDYYDLFGRRANKVYWSTYANGMAPTGSMTFTPPSGGSINGKAADATQVFNAATGPAEFLIIRQNATTWFIEDLTGNTTKV